MDTNTFRIVTLIVELVAAVFAIYIAPKLGTYFKDKKIDSVIDKAVKASQQMLWEKDGEERKKYAIETATEELTKLGIKITDKQLSDLIEAAVMQMHIDKGDYIGNDEN